MKINNLRIGLRLAFAFGTILFLLAVISVVNIVQLRHIDVDTDVMEAASDRERLAQEWLRAIETNVVRTGATARTADAAEEKRYKDEIAATRERVNQVQKALEDAVTSDKGRQLMDAIAERRKAYLSTRDAILAAKAAAGAEGAVFVANRIDSEFVPQSKDYIASVNILVEHLKDEFMVAHDDLHARSTNAQVMLLSASGMSLLLGAILAWWLTRSITRPLNQAVAVAEAVSSGDLTSRIVAPSRDEVGHLLNALARMNESLRKIVTEVRTSTHGTAAASQQIAAGNQDLSARTEQQAGALEETASAMEELTSTVRQNADNAVQANTLAVSASQTAEKGGVVVGDVVRTMESIHEASRKVVDIISVIDGIAFQTNILALNAAVEAARAGEQGRGFAVVAAEVRTLAQRSAAAAKEIKLLIDASAVKVEQGMQQVHGAGQTMQEIVGGVKRVSDIISEIAAASKEQTSGIEQINKAITQMDQVTQQNAALVEESAAAAMALRDQAEKLSHSVDAFRLGDQNVAVTASAIVPAALRAMPAKASALRSVLPPANATIHSGDDWAEF